MELSVEDDTEWLIPCKSAHEMKWNSNFCLIYFRELWSISLILCWVEWRVGCETDPEQLQGGSSTESPAGSKVLGTLCFVLLQENSA